MGCDDMGCVDRGCVDSEMSGGSEEPILTESVVMKEEGETVDVNVS